MSAREQAAVLLGAAAPAPGSPAAAYVAALAALLEFRGDPGARAEQAAHLERLAALSERGRRPLQALTDVERATTALAELSSPREILEASAAALAQLGGLRRVVLGTVERATLAVQRVVVRDDAAEGARLLGALRGAEIRLGHPFLEADLLRRRRAVVVDAEQEAVRVHPVLASVMRWGELVAAPVATGSSVAAILYADAGPQTPLEPGARELVSRFVAEVARTYETARLRRAIGTERRETQRFATGLEHRSRELLETAHQLELASPADAVLARRAAPAAGGSVFSGVLTPRELEVLQLLSTGHTNRAIADQLVLSPSTVKSHVYRILTKLDVANRAQAVALYLTPRGEDRSPAGS